VAGFTILNGERARRSGAKWRSVSAPAKGKDFATRSSVPVIWMNRPRRQGDRHDLGMEARERAYASRGNARDMHYTFGQMIARASQDVYFSRDVIGSAPWGRLPSRANPRSTPDAQPGDEVTLEIELRRPDELNRLISARGNVMPMYHTLGQVPHKRHTQFRRPDGKLTPSS
jgi:fumarylacetoacetate (FAA) hydrolase